MRGLRNADINGSTYSRKSRGSMPFRTNSYAAGIHNGMSDRAASRNTDRSGKETVVSHMTRDSQHRHSLVKPIGLEGQ